MDESRQIEISDDLREKFSSFTAKVNGEEPATEGEPSPEETEEIMEDQEPTETPTDDQPEENLDESVVIPPRLLQAGRRAKMGEDAINLLAAQHPEVLERIAKAQDDLSAGFGELGKLRKQSKEQPDKPDDEKKPNINGLQLQYDPEQYDETMVNGVIKPMQGQIERLTSTVNDLTQSNEAQVAQAQESFNQQVDGHFDAIANQYPELGATVEMTDQQSQLRSQVAQLAGNIANNFAGMGRQLSLNEALDRAMQIINPDAAKAVAEREMTEKLERGKKRISARPVSRKSATPGKTGRDAAIEKVREFGRKRGIANLTN